MPRKYALSQIDFTSTQLKIRGVLMGVTGELHWSVPN